MIVATLASLLFGLGTAVCWGVADFWAAKATKRSSAESSAVWVSIIATVTYLLVYLVSRGNSDWNTNGIIYAIFAGILLELGLYIFYRGLDVGPVSIVSPISSAYPFISTLVLLLFFQTKLTILELVGVFIIVLGVVLASGIMETKQSERKFSTGLIYASLTVVLWGSAYALLGQAVNTIGWQKATLVDTLAGFISLFSLFAITQREALKKSLHLDQAKNPFIIGTALTQLLGGIIFTIGISKTKSPAIIIALSATYPALTILLALKHLDEKKQLSSLAGAFLTIIGVVILTLHGSRL